MRRFKILHTIRQGNFGGGETHVQELVKHINKQKFESYVLAFGEGEMHDKLYDMGVPSFVIPTSAPFDFTVKKQVKNLAREIQPDLIHAHGARACSNSYFLGKTLDIPLVYTVHGWTFRDSMNLVKHWIRRKTEKFLTRKSDLVINVSYGDYMLGREILGIQHSVEIVNGVDAKIFNGEGDKSLKQHAGFETDDFVVCMIARMTEQKDPLTFIRAIDHLKEVRKIKALVVGDGELLQDARVLAHKLQISDKIHFTGFRKDIHQILSWADAYCLPSLWEGLPIGILEAMSSGCAVLASNVTGNKEIVTDETGILFEPGDYKGLARGIKLLYRKPAFKNYLEKNANQLIRRHFTIRRMVKRVTSHYLRLLR